MFAPFCADDRPAAERQQDPNPFLFEEEWHARSGIVTATITDLSDYYEDRGAAPTLAGTATESHCFWFVDGKLYQIYLTFPQSDSPTVIEAMIGTYGKPTSTTTDRVHNAFGAEFSNTTVLWDNGVSTIILMERSSDLNTSSVHFTHHKLHKIAESRRPKPRL